MQKVSIKRIAIALAIVFGCMAVVSGLVSAVFYLQGRYEVYEFPLHEAQDAGAKPEMKLLPTPLADASLSPETNVTMESYSGWTFGIPEESMSDEREYSSALVIRFHDGRSLAIFKPLVGGYTLGKIFAQAGVLTSEEASSNYVFVSHAMSTLPGDASFWSTHKRNSRAAALLLQKELMVGPGAKAVHPVETPYVRGYEVVSSFNGKSQYHLWLFDQQDDEIELMASRYTQAQLNTVISLVRGSSENKPLVPASAG